MDLDFITTLDGVDTESSTVRTSSIFTDTEYMMMEEDKHGLLTYTFASNPTFPSRTHLLAIPYDYPTNSANMAMINMDYGVNDRWGFLPSSVYGSPEEYYFEAGRALEDQWFEAYSEDGNFYIDFVFDRNSYPETQIDMNGLTFQFKYHCFVQDGC